MNCEEYKAIRHLSTDLTQRIIRHLSRKTVQKGAKELGMLDGQTLRFENETEMTVLFDYCFHFCREKQPPILLERDNGGYAPESDEYRILTRMTQGVYSIFLLEKSLGLCSLNFLDMLTGKSYTVYDANLAQYAGSRLGMAGMLIPIDDDEQTWMSTGALLPIASATAIAQLKKITVKFVDAVDSGKLTPNRRKVLAKQTIRLLLRHGASNQGDVAEA